MKKCFLVLILITFVVGGAFAQSESNFSMGAGGFFTSDFGGGVEASVSGFGVIGDIKTPYAGAGAFVFFDFNYVELSLGFFSIGGNWEEKEYVTGASVKHKFSGTGIDLGVLAKYPFVINEQFKLFPLLGLCYRSALSVELNGLKANDPEKLSTIWLKLGGGFDYSFTDKIYLRAGFLYGIRLENQFERDTEDSLRAEGAMNLLNLNTERLLGHGLDVKLAIGRKF